MEIVLPDDQIAWGQFLDDGRNKRQFGVLGTSAAIQVLSSMGTAATSVQRAQQTLPYLSVSESPKCQHELNDRTSTFKVLAALDAYEPTTKKFDSQVAYPLAANYLLNAQIENEGWGNYFRSDADRDDKSAVEPTALTLIALHRFGRCIADERCTKALDWLSGELEPRQTESPAADALGVLAFSKFEGSESKSERVSLAHQNCVVRLSQWRKTPRDIAFHSEYHYEIPDGFGGGESKYIFFPVAILVALALLKSQYSKSSDRTWAARVCQEVAARVRRDGGFRVWGHVSTVDQCWANQLLLECEELVKSRPSDLLPPPLNRIQSRMAKWTTLGATLVSGLLGAYWAIVSHSATFRILGSALTAVSFGFFVALIMAWYAKGDRSH